MRQGDRPPHWLKLRQVNRYGWRLRQRVKQRVCQSSWSVFPCKSSGTRQLRYRQRRQVSQLDHELLARALWTVHELSDISTAPEDKLVNDVDFVTGDL